jgi:hypothetical protein
MTLGHPTLNQIATDINESADLRALLTNLRRFEDACRSLEIENEMMPGDLIVENELRWRKIDICMLPVFGKPEPKDTTGIWSWDDGEVLAGEGPFAEWRIVEREDA